MFKTFLSVSAVFSMICAVANANLGDSLRESVDKYGNTYKWLEYEGYPMYRFVSDGYIVDAVFKNDITVLIRYVKNPGEKKGTMWELTKLTDDDIQKLLRSNGGLSWTQSVDIREFYTNDNGVIKSLPGFTKLCAHLGCDAYINVVGFEAFERIWSLTIETSDFFSETFAISERRNKAIRTILWPPKASPSPER